MLRTSRLFFKSSIQNSSKLIISAKRNYAVENTIAEQQEVKGKIQMEESTPAQYLNILLNAFHSMQKQEGEKKAHFLMYQIFRYIVSFKEWQVPFIANDLYVINNNEKLAILFTEDNKWKQATQVMGLTEDEINSISLKTVPSILQLLTSNRIFSDLCINYGSLHDFFITSSQSNGTRSTMDMLWYWSRVLQFEEKAHLLKQVNDAASKKQEQALTQEEQRVVNEAMKAMLNFDQFWVILDGGRLKQVPIKSSHGKRYPLIFSAPDLAYQFAQLMQVDIANVKCVSGKVLFEKIAKTLNEQQTIDGISMHFMSPTKNDAVEVLLSPRIAQEVLNTKM